MPRAIVLGGGAHAKVAIDLAQVLGYDLVGFLDPAREGETLLGVPRLGGLDDIGAAAAAAGVELAVLGLGGIGDNGPRHRLYEEAVAAGLTLPSLVHPRATVSRHVRLGPGCQLFPGAIVNADTVLGCDVIVNTGAIVEHDCVVGDHANISPNACVGGTCRIGEGAHVGMGASIIQKLRVGAGAIVGAGAVVIGDVPDGATVIGVPARVRG